MTAPRIVNITVNATQAEYPQKVVTEVEWDQPIVFYQVENLIFETESEPGITITGYTGAQDKPAPFAVFLGQTLVQGSNVNLITPTRMRISFTVSPFMQGYLRISNQPWNKPLVLEARNADGAKGDWSPLLAPGVFSGVVCRAYYSAMQPTNTTSISWNDPLYGTPKLRKDWSCSQGTSGGLANAFDGVDIRISRTNDFSEEPIVDWDGGNFWWWGCDGVMSSKNPLPPYPWENYYSTSDPRTCSGPMNYLFGGVGGLTVDTTWLPSYNTNIAWQLVKNKYGSTVASNYTSNFGTSNLYRNYSPCNIFGTYSGNKYTSRNSNVGRMERWILANPFHGDPLEGMPSTWTNQLPSSVNNNCLAPWRLSQPTDPVPMLIQVYYQLNWIFTTNNPG